MSSIDTANRNGTGDGAPVVPIRHFAAHRLEVPAAVEPLTSARSLRVGEVLEAAEHASTRGGRAA